MTDLAVLSSQGLDVYLANGSGGFLPPTHYDAGLDPTGVTVADVTGNGIADLVVSDEFGDSLVLLGNGHGGFAPYQSLNQQIALTIVSTGNAASGPEFIFADPAQNQVSLQVEGKLEALGTPSAGLQSPGAVVSADLSGDGIPDLIVANSGGNDVLVYPGLGNGAYGAPEVFPVGTDPVAIAVGDLTGDGIPDLAVVDQGSNDVSILLGSGEGSSWTLTPGPRLQAGSGPDAITIADVSGNGIADLLVSDGASGQVRLIPGVGGGYFNDANPTVFNVGNDPGPLFVGSFTGSSQSLDLITLNAGSNTLTLIRGINLGNDQEETIASGGQFPSSAVMGNFDGTLGLLVANNGDGRLALFLAGDDGLVSRGFLPGRSAPPHQPGHGFFRLDLWEHQMASSRRFVSCSTSRRSLGGRTDQPARDVPAPGRSPGDPDRRPDDHGRRSRGRGQCAGPGPWHVVGTRGGRVADAAPVPAQTAFQDQLAENSWDGQEATSVAAEQNQAVWDPVAWVVAGLDEAFQHAKVTSFAAAADVATSAGPEIPQPAEASDELQGETAMPVGTASPGMPDDVGDRGKNPARGIDQASHSRGFVPGRSRAAGRHRAEPERG